MKSGKGQVTKGAQSEWRGLDKSDKLATKRASCGVMSDHYIETGLAKLMRDAVRFVEGNKGFDVLKANETLLKAEMD